MHKLNLKCFLFSQDDLRRANRDLNKGKEEMETLTSKIGESVEGTGGGSLGELGAEGPGGYGRRKGGKRDSQSGRNREKRRKNSQ